MKFVQSEDPADFAAAIDEKTKGIYVESIGNPKYNVAQIPEIAEVGTPCSAFGNTSHKSFKVAHAAGIPLIVDNTFGAGGYLIRHEIIALHLAVSMGGAEFYPMCTQVMIGGSGSGTPSPTVSFPGAYNDNDPGIYDPNVSPVLALAAQHR